MLIALLASAGLLQASAVADYFPVQPNTKWTFSQDTDGIRDSVTYTAMPAVKVGKEMATELELNQGGATTDFYYVLKNDSLLLVATDPVNPFSDPRPLIRLNTPAKKWHWDFMQQGSPCNVDSELRDGFKKDVLGVPRDTICVTMKAVIGNKAEMTVTQTAYYAKGIGLVQMDVDQKTGRSHHHITQILTKYEPSSTSQ